jgi:pimeloyl-ACP methyl ester carboxylesterase
VSTKREPQRSGSFSGGTERQRMLAGVPLSERRIDVAGTTTVVLEGGDGPPLVLLHGGIECGGAYWAPVISWLAESHRLVIPDLPGLGESEPLERMEADAFASWFTSLIRLTCDQEPDLVAHSLLGSFSARLAIDRSAHLRRLVIYGAPGVGPYRMPLGLRVVAIRFGLRPTERNAERFDRWGFFDLDRARTQAPGWLEAFSRYTMARARVPHVKRTMRALIGTGTKRIPDAELRRIEAPAALVWGRHDRFVPLRLAEGTSTRLGWPLRVIDDSGHVPHIERPQAFVSALQAVLRETNQRVER